VESFLQSLIKKEKYEELSVRFFASDILIEFSKDIKNKDVEEENNVF